MKTQEKGTLFIWELARKKQQTTFFCVLFGVKLALNV